MKSIFKKYFSRHIVFYWCRHIERGGKIEKNYDKKNERKRKKKKYEPSEKSYSFYMQRSLVLLHTKYTHQYQLSGHCMYVWSRYVHKVWTKCNVQVSADLRPREPIGINLHRKSYGWKKVHTLPAVQSIREVPTSIYANTHKRVNKWNFWWDETQMDVEWRAIEMRTTNGGVASGGGSGNDINTHQKKI